jgi:hypothetical protein
MSQPGSSAYLTPNAVVTSLAPSSRFGEVSFNPWLDNGHFTYLNQLRLGQYRGQEAGNRSCVFCHRAFTNEHENQYHALNCMHGGLRTTAHNEFRNVIRDLAREAGLSVQLEPRPFENGDRLDLIITGISNAVRAVGIDTTIASVFVQQEYESILPAAEHTKRTKYQARCEDRGIDFIPIAVDVFGRLGKGAEPFMVELARAWSSQNGVERRMGLRYVRARVSNALARNLGRLLSRSHAETAQRHARA